MKRELKIVLGPVILIGTLAAFAYYLQGHPQVIDRLKSTSVGTVAKILLLYTGTLLTLVVLLYASLPLYKKSIGLRENFLLNAYSSLVNFFGPGQSGPGFRAAYLKIKHGILLKQYIFMTLIYYSFYTVFSGLLLFAAVLPWWQTGLLLFAISAFSSGLIKLFVRRERSVVVDVPPAVFLKAISLIAAATLVQVSLIAAVYSIELRSLDPGLGLSQIIAYTGVANFSLFVALTPGSIGIREAFLLFTQDLHGVSKDIIITANVLDRAIYILFLGTLFLVILAMHVGPRLDIKKVQRASAVDR